MGELDSFPLLEIGMDEPAVAARHPDSDEAEQMRQHAVVDTNLVFSVYNSLISSESPTNSLLSLDPSSPSASLDHFPSSSPYAR